jgi:hypothetical protein
MTRAPDGAIVRITYTTWEDVAPGHVLLAPTGRGYRIIGAARVKDPEGHKRPVYRLTCIVLGDRTRWRKRPPKTLVVHALFWHPRDAIRAKRRGQV